MERFGAVDRLMQQATEPVAHSAKEVLEAQITATEPALPPKTNPEPQNEAHSMAHRGRQFFGALRPLLPAVTRAVSLVNHPAAQTASRILPLLSSLGGYGASASSSASATAQAQKLKEILQTADERHTTLAAAVELQATTLGKHEDQLRRVRETLAKITSEENTLETTLRQLRDRVRLLMAAVVILLLLVLAEMVLLFTFEHR